MVLLVPVLRWYRAEYHVEELQQYLLDLESNVGQVLSCLDLFGASKRVAETWIRAGYAACAFDIKLNVKHDIVTERGFKLLMAMGMQLPAWINFNFLGVALQCFFWHFG